MVSVNLTAMLVLATMFIGGRETFDFTVANSYLFSVSKSLPTTSYIKMVDIWLIFNLFLPFSEVILHTYLHYLRYSICKHCIYFTFPKRGQRKYYC